MAIQSTVRIAKVKHSAQHKMQKLTTGNYDIAQPEEIDSEILFEGHKHQFQLI
jgi:hypothetical protein